MTSLPGNQLVYQNQTNGQSSNSTQPGLLPIDQTMQPTHQGSFPFNWFLWFWPTLLKRWLNCLQLHFNLFGTQKLCLHTEKTSNFARKELYLSTCLLLAVPLLTGTMQSGFTFPVLTTVGAPPAYSYIQPAPSASETSLTQNQPAPEPEKSPIY